MLYRRITQLTRSLHAIEAAADWRPSSKAGQLTLALALGLALAGYLVAFGINTLLHAGRVSPDSVVYLDAAQQMVLGHGISSSFYPLDLAVEQNRWFPVPLTAYSPGYPVAIAALHGVGIPAKHAAHLVAVLFYGTVLVAAFALVRTTAGLGAGIVAVAFLMHFAPLDTAARYAWSETMGLAFLLGGFAAVHRRRPVATTPRRDLPALMLFIAGLAVGGAYATRYALAPALLVLLFGMIDRENWKRTLRRAILVLAGFFCVAGPVMLRNLIHAHGLGHAIAVRDDMTLLRVLHDLRNAVAPSIVPSRSVAAIVALALVAAIALRLTTSRGRRQTWIVARRALTSGPLLLWLWPPTYLVFLIYAEMYTNIDPIGPRLVLPAMTVLIVAGVGGAFRLVRLPRTFTALAATILLVPPVWTEVADAATVLRVRKDHWTFGDPTTTLPEDLGYLARHATADDLIIAGRGLFVPYYLDSMRSLYFFDDIEVSPQELAEYLARHRNDFHDLYVVVRANILGSSGTWDSVDYKTYFRDATGGRTMEFPAEGSFVIVAGRLPEDGLQPRP